MNIGKFFTPVNPDLTPPRPFGQAGGYLIDSEDRFNDLKAQWPTYVLTDTKDDTPFKDSDGCLTRVWDGTNLIPPTSAQTTGFLRDAALARLKEAHQEAALEPVGGDYSTARTALDASYFAEKAVIEAETDPEVLKAKGALP